MEALLKLFGVRRRNQGWMTFILLWLMFIFILWLLRSCVGGLGARSDSLTVNQPVVPSGAVVGDELALSGTAAANKRVDLYLNDTRIGSTSADRAGHWNYATTADAPGRYRLQLRSTDSDGDDLQSSVYPFVVYGARNIDEFGAVNNMHNIVGDGSELSDDAAFGARMPVIGPGIEGVTVAPGAFTIIGTGTPGSRVLLTNDGQSLGIVRVADNGTFRLNTNFSTPGSYRIEAASADVVGLGSSGATLTVAEQIERPTIRIVRYGVSTTRVLRGTGEPGATLMIRNNGDELGTVTVDDNGNWSLSDVDAPYERNVFTATMVRDGNDVSASGEAVLIRRGGVGTVDAGDDDGASVGLVTPTLQVAGASSPVDLSGTGAPNTTLTIDRNGVAIGTVDVDADGNWTLADVELEPGENTFVAVGEADGDAIPVSSPVTVDGGAAMAAAAIDGAALAFDADSIAIDGDGNLVGTIGMEGTGAPVGSTVVLYYDGEAIGTGEIDADGNWSIQTDVPVTPGEHELYAAIVGDDGSNSAETSVATINVEAPTATLSVSFADAAADSEEGAEGEESEAGDGDGAGAGASGQPVVELILDASWSMTFPLDSAEEADRLLATDPNSRIGVARAALVDIIENTLPEGQPFALRAFGNRLGNLQCQTTLEFPVQPLDKFRTVDWVQRTGPQFNANTAIAQSLAAVADDLAGVSGTKTVVLLTDGQETCGGDPAAEIQRLRDSGIDVKIDVVGFAILDDDLRAEFESWAELGGGQYFDARDADQLADALALTLQAGYRVVDADREEVATGFVGGAPVELPVGAYTVIVGGLEYDVVVGAEGAEVLVR